MSPLLLSRFTDRALKAMSLAQRQATERNHSVVTSAHVLLALLVEHGVGCKVLWRLGLSLEHQRDSIAALADTAQSAVSAGLVAFGTDVEQLLSEAKTQSKVLGHNFVGTEHLVLALLTAGAAPVRDFLIKQGITLERARETLLDEVGCGSEHGLNGPRNWLGLRPLVIGMVHVPALPGSARFAGNLEALHERVRGDLRALVDGGIDHVMIENFGDAPFFPRQVPAITLTHLTAIAQRVKREFPVRLGINVLRNDGCGALAVAHAVGAEFIRVNVLCGARVTDQGIVEGIAHDLLRLRANLGAEHIAILADVAVKHSAPLGPRPIEDEVHDVIERGGAGAVIVSGRATGQTADCELLAKATAAAGSTPVLIGSGANVDNIEQLTELASGVIVGTSLKRGGIVTEPVDVDRVRAFVVRVREAKLSNAAAGS
jgi:uncharacterized protein